MTFFWFRKIAVGFLVKLYRKAQMEITNVNLSQDLDRLTFKNSWFRSQSYGPCIGLLFLCQNWYFGLSHHFGTNDATQHIKDIIWILENHNMNLQNCKIFPVWGNWIYGEVNRQKMQSAIRIVLWINISFVHDIDEGNMIEIHKITNIGEGYLFDSPKKVLYKDELFIVLLK